MAGTITQSHKKIGIVRHVIFTCTGDSSDGSFPATAITDKIEGSLIKLVTNPGSTAPTDNYDVTLTDQDGLDVLAGNGANRDTANTESVVIIHSAGIYSVVSDSNTLTLNITGNSVNSAGIIITLYYTPGVGG